MFNGNFMKNTRQSNAGHQNNMTQGSGTTMNGFGAGQQQAVQG